MRRNFSCPEKDKVVDTKKRTLDRYVIEWAEKASREIDLPFYDLAEAIVEDMAGVFTDRDRLLRQVGAVTLYFHLFRLARKGGWTTKIQRHMLEEFEQARLQNRTDIESGKNGDMELIDFDRYAQSSNDAYAVKIRLHKLLKAVFNTNITIEDL